MQAVAVSLVDLTDDALLTLAFIMGEERLPSMRQGTVLVWESPIAGAAVNLCSLGSTCRALRLLMAPSVDTLRKHLLTMLRDSVGEHDSWVTAAAFAARVPAASGARLANGRRGAICARGSPSHDEHVPLSDVTLLLWRAALLERPVAPCIIDETARNRSTSQRERDAQSAAAAVTERELAAMHLQPSYSATEWRPLTTPRRLQHSDSAAPK